MRGIVRLQFQRFIEQVASRAERCLRCRLIGDCLGAQYKVNCFSALRFLMFTTSGFYIDDLKTDGPRETPDDLILNLKKVRLRGVEAVSPYLVSCLGIYKMGINTHAWTLGQNTSFEHVAHVK